MVGGAGAAKAKEKEKADKVATINQKEKHYLQTKNIKH